MIISVLLFLLVIHFSFGRLSRRAMGTDAVARAARLERIARASWWIQLLMVICFVGMAYTLLAFFMGWPMFSESKVRIVISQSHIYTAAADMPGEIFWLWLGKMFFWFVAYGVVFSLFGLYRKGQLFTARAVLHIRSLGYFLIINWAFDDQMQSTLRDMNLSTVPILIGLLIIFVSWIMDEGRKIQEEQELTV
jgi:hypothetical protein